MNPSCDNQGRSAPQEALAPVPSRGLLLSLPHQDTLRGVQCVQPGGHPPAGPEDFPCLQTSQAPCGHPGAWTGTQYTHPGLARLPQPWRLVGGRNQSRGSLQCMEWNEVSMHSISPSLRGILPPRASSAVHYVHIHRIEPITSTGHRTQSPIK